MFSIITIYQYVSVYYLGKPTLTKKIDLASGKIINISPTAGADISEIFGDVSSEQRILKSPSRKYVDIKTNKSHSDDSFSESLKYLKESNSGSAISSKKVVTKNIDVKGKVHDIHSQHSVGDELQALSRDDTNRKDRKVGRSVKLVGNTVQSLQSSDFENFANEQGLESLASVSSEDSKKRLPAKTINFDSSGNKKVVLSNDFEEYTVSSLRSLDSDKDLKTTASNYKQKTKTVSLKGDVSYSQEFEDYSSQSLLHLRNINDLDVIESGTHQPRQVTSHVSFADDGSRNVTYSSEFESFSQGQSISGLRQFHSETDLETLSKYQDQKLSSWVEGKHHKHRVEVSDESENYSFGPEIQFKSNKQGKKWDVYKTVAYKDGKRLVSYSDEFLSTLSYSDDFENSTNSWAVKLRRDSEQSLVTKHVAYKDGKKHVTYSSDVEETFLKPEETEEDVGSSFKEITLEDLEEHSYTEDFESFTAKLHSTTK